MNVTKDVKYIGVNDHNVDLFEGQYVVPNGMAYNSYVIMDSKIAVMDTVDKRKKDEWLKNLSDCLGDKKPDYLVVSHMEPDHAANIAHLAGMYPDMKVVLTDKALKMIPQFFDVDLTERAIVATEGGELSL